MAMIKTCKAPDLQEKSASGSVATFNTALAMPLASCNIAVNAWQEGSGTPSPSNPRPISGYSAINIGVVGKNWLNNPDKTITEASYVINNVYTPMVAGFYVLSFEFSGTNNSSSLRIDDENGTPIFTTSKTVTNGHNEFFINLPSNGSFVKFYSNAVGTYSKFQIERGSQFTTYEPYTGNTYTINFGQTVNEATYNARTGILEVTQPSVQTLQLPPCPIDTLEGVNNIFADTGDVDLTYKDLDIAKRGNFREVFRLP